jgi:hypothetical protein
MKAKLMGVAALGLLVAACGTDPRERTTGGAAAGAATGATVGALAGPVGVLAGAAIGGGAGAITGATTDARDVNLGRPIWNNPETRVPGMTHASGMRSGRGSMAASGNARQAQQALASRGFDPGPADGVWGARSQQAAMGFQRANNLEATGRLDAATLNALNVSAARMPGSSDRGSMSGTQMSQLTPPTTGGQPPAQALQTERNTQGMSVPPATGTSGLAGGSPGSAGGGSQPNFSGSSSGGGSELGGGAVAPGRPPAAPATGSN